MTKILMLTKTDVKNIFREQMLYFMFVFAPLLTLAGIRWLVPWLGAKFPVITPYYSLILLFLILNIVTGLGFVIASILLDERDEDVLTAIRVMPISANTFLLYRLGFTYLIAFLFTFIAIQFSGLVSFNLIQTVLIAILFALVAPMLTLLMVIFSRNKVEGLAVYKALNLFIFLPAVTFFIDSIFRYLLAIFPLYWSFQYLWEIAHGGKAWTYLGIALVFNFALLFGLFIWFKRKVFR